MNTRHCFDLLQDIQQLHVTTIIQQHASERALTTSNMCYAILGAKIWNKICLHGSQFLHLQAHTLTNLAFRSLTTSQNDKDEEL